MDLKARVIFGLIAVVVAMAGVARAQGTLVVTGRVAYPTGEPAVGAEVYLRGADGAEVARALVDDTGRFQLAIAAGVYRLEASVAGVATALRTITVAGPETVADLVLRYSDEVIEVKGRYRTEGEQLQESARAVQVIETEQAKRRTADLGEVLARTQGIGVRRSGGLGSDSRFSLNGLTDDQIRFFIDGVPLELAGYPFGLVNVPVNLVERAEVYRGVVPISFGADALGGAVNLVTEQDARTSKGSVSYQSGSFGTHRVTGGAAARHAGTGAFVRADAFLDRADNDYPIVVDLPSERPGSNGQAVPTRVDRFHDGYQAGGGALELGVAGKPWAERLGARVFASQFDRELQSNPTMDRAFGDVTFDRSTVGGMLRYQHRPRTDVPVDVVAGYAHTRVQFLDVGTCQYNWLGECERERMGDGEVAEGNPRDDTLWEHAVYGRSVVGWDVRSGHALRGSVSPTYIAREGRERRSSDSNDYGAVSADRDLTTVVAGFEYEADLIGDRLENIAFVKSYAQWLKSRAGVLGTGIDRSLARDRLSFGGGDSLRYRFVDGLYAKASYEYATRLPEADEVFGDAVQVNENLDLVPETSHNANLGVTLDLRETRSGAWRGDVNGFVRDAKNLIVTLPAANERLRAENLYAARSLGVEASAGWTSRGEHVALDGNVTYLDFRNLLAKGLFAQFGGDRVPNRPYLMANGSAQLQVKDLALARDRVAVSWDTRYVHQYFKYWESAGTRASKHTIASQLVHSLALTYLVERDARALSFTAELSNLTDRQTFDFYGAQRPGRAVYFKTTAEF